MSKVTSPGVNVCVNGCLSLFGSVMNSGQDEAGKEDDWMNCRQII